MMPIRFNVESPGVGRLTLARPDYSNAFSAELLRLFRQHLEVIRADRSLRAVLLTSEGKNFCGGLDLREAAQSDDVARNMSRDVIEILSTLRHLPQIVVGAVRGAARAGGGALVAACDLVVAADNFNIAFPEIRRGLEPVLLFPLLRRRLPAFVLSELLLTGLPIDAEKAARYGLVHRIVAPGSEIETASGLIEDVFRGDPESVRTAKELILVQETSSAGCSLRDEFFQSLENHLSSWRSNAAREGIAAFLQKREPEFPPF